MEIMCTVPGRRSLGMTIAGIALFGAAVVNFLLLLRTGVMVFMFFFLVWGLVWFFLIFRMEVEFDYIYYPTDGDLEVARITNKSRRKLILQTNLDEMMLLAPEGNDAILQYSHDASFKRIDYSSKRRGAKCYLLFCKGRKDKICLRFEPSNEMLLAIKERNGKVKQPGKMVL